MSALPIGEACPDCKDGSLVERVNSKTKNTFIGCSEWPDCEFTKSGGSSPAPAKVQRECYCYDYEDDFDDDGYYMGDMWGEF